MNAIELKLEDIYRGKATMIKNNKYFTTQQYIEPFVDRVDKMCQGNFIVKALPAKQISLTPQGQIDTEDIVFNRVWVQGILPGEFAYENHQQSISMLYALDSRKPLVKLFKSVVNAACLNLCVFSPEYLNIQELQPEAAVDYSFIEHVLQMVDDTRVHLEALAKMSFTVDEIKDILGNWIDKCIKYKYTSTFGTIKLPETLPIDVYKSVTMDEKSPYYAKHGITDGFQVYNAFTDIICNKDTKDIINKYEKVKLVSDLFNEN